MSSLPNIRMPFMYAADPIDHLLTMLEQADLHLAVFGPALRRALFTPEPAGGEEDDEEGESIEETDEEEEEDEEEEDEEDATWIVEDVDSGDDTAEYVPDAAELEEVDEEDEEDFLDAWWRNTTQEESGEESESEAKEAKTPPHPNLTVDIPPNHGRIGTPEMVPQPAPVTPQRMMTRFRLRKLSQCPRAPKRTRRH